MACAGPPLLEELDELDELELEELDELELEELDELELEELDELELEELVSTAITCDASQFEPVMPVTVGPVVQGAVTLTVISHVPPAL